MVHAGKVADASLVGGRWELSPSNGLDWGRNLYFIGSHAPIGAEQAFAMPGSLGLTEIENHLEK